MSAGHPLWITPHWVIYVAGYGSVAIAFLVGEWEERAFAGAEMLMVLVSALAGFNLYGSHLALDGLEDAFVLAVAAAIALRSDKAWPLAAASLVLAMLMTNVAQRLLHASAWAYGTVQLVWQFMLDGLLIAAAASAWRARRRGRGRRDRGRGAGPAEAEPA